MTSERVQSPVPRQDSSIDIVKVSTQLRAWTPGPRGLQDIGSCDKRHSLLAQSPLEAECWGILLSGVWLLFTLHLFNSVKLC